MIDKISRKIYFYRIYFRKHRERVEPKDVIDHINTLTRDLNGRYFPKKDGDMWSIEIDSSSPSLRAQMGTIRRRNLPLLWTEGRIRPLSISSDEGLYEPMHFMIFTEETKDRTMYDIAGFEYNHYGPKASNLELYIPKKAFSLADEVELVPLIWQDVHKMIDRIRELQIFELRVHRDTEKLLTELDKSLPSAIAALKQTTDAECIEIVLRSEKYTRNRIRVPFLDKIPEWLSKPDVKEAVDALKITGKDRESGETVEFNLLEQYLVSEEQVIKSDDAHKSVNTDAMYNAIQSAYHNLKSEITRIVEGK